MTMGGGCESVENDGVEGRRGERGEGRGESDGERERNVKRCLHYTKQFLLLSFSLFFCNFPREVIIIFRCGPLSYFHASSFFFLSGRASCQLCLQETREYQILAFFYGWGYDTRDVKCTKYMVIKKSWSKSVVRSCFFSFSLDLIW